jgi:excisionase family DNA binding protein
MSHGGCQLKTEFTQTNAKEKEDAMRRKGKEGPEVQDINRELLDIREAAGYTRLQKSTIRAWIHQRRLPSVKLGRRVFLRRKDLDRLISKSVRPALETV